MKRIAVVTDSSAYIPASALQGLLVHVIPIWLLWDEDRLRDGVDIDPPAFYRRLETSKTLPTLSQPSPGEFVDFFRQVAAGAAFAPARRSVCGGKPAAAEEPEPSFLFDGPSLRSHDRGPVCDLRCPLRVQSDRVPARGGACEPFTTRTM